MVSLSNIGDVVLTLPVVDILCASFPGAELHLIVSPKAQSLFDGNTHITRVIGFDKRMSWRGKLAWFWGLRSRRFDLVVDLRNSMLPFVLNAGTVTFPACVRPKIHMKAKHLARLALVLDDVSIPADRYGIMLSAAQSSSVDRLVQGWENYVVLAPGAADLRKRWSEKNFLRVLQHLHAKGKNVVLVGDQNDKAAGAHLAANFSDGVIDLCGRTTLVELAGVISRAALALTNDSGIMHLASYFDRPVIALFGRTDPFFYGPWSSTCVALRKGVVMEDITAEDVMAEVDKFLC